MVFTGAITTDEANGLVMETEKRQNKIEIQCNKKYDTNVMKQNGMNEKVSKTFNELYDVSFMEENKRYVNCDSYRMM